MGGQALKRHQLYQRAGGQLIKHRGKGRWKACAAEGWSSAKVTLVRRYITASRISAQQCAHRQSSYIAVRVAMFGQDHAAMQTFAIMGGLYAAVGCFMQRLRQKNDGEPFWSLQMLLVNCL